MKGIVWKNATSSAELPRDYCAGIGPLQLGVALVFSYFFRNADLFSLHLFNI